MQTCPGVRRGQGLLRNARVAVDAAARVQVEVGGLARAPGGDGDAQGAGGGGPLGGGHVLEACVTSDAVGNQIGLVLGTAGLGVAQRRLA